VTSFISRVATYRRAVSAFSDGTIRRHRASDGQKLVALFAYNDPKQWAASRWSNATTETTTAAECSKLIAAALQHGVAPALYARLNELGNTIPPDLIKKLRGIYLNSVARNARLFYERDRILRALTGAHIPIVPFKGACLAETAYRNVALRSMEDIDLWVQRHQLDAARAIMQTLGYTSRSKADRPQPLQDALGGETQFFKSNGPMVELHWNIFPGEWLRHAARIDEQVVWQRTQPFYGERIRQLSPEDTVIQLCIHLAVNHQMSENGLRTLLDLDYARRAWRIDWPVVGQRAKAWQVSYATWLVLKLLSDALGDPENQLPLSELAPSAPRQFALSCFVSVRRLAKGIHLSSGPRRFLLLLLLVDRPIDFFGLLRRGLFPDTAWLTLRYGLLTAPRWRIWLQRIFHSVLVSIRWKI
jgi:hypothetical protein